MFAEVRRVRKAKRSTYSEPNPKLLRRSGDRAAMAASKMPAIAPQKSDVVANGNDPSDMSTLANSSTRALYVFEFFHSVQRPAREVEIRNALRLPKSTTNALLKTLLDHGYLTFDSRTRTYLPSFRLVKVGQWLSTFYFGPQQILQVMEDLSDSTGAAAVLSMPCRFNMYLLATLNHIEPGWSTYLDGRRNDFVGSASGGAYMMTLSDMEVMEMVRNTVPLGSASADNDPVAASEVLQRVRQFRSQGYSVNFGKRRGADTLFIAMPLPHSASSIPLFMSLGGPKDKMAGREHELAAALRKFIARIS